MKKLKLKLPSTKESLSKEQMKKITGGDAYIITDRDYCQGVSDGTWYCCLNNTAYYTEYADCNNSFEVCQNYGGSAIATYAITCEYI